MPPLAATFRQTFLGSYLHDTAPYDIAIIDDVAAYASDMIVGRNARIRLFHLSGSTFMR